MKKPIYILLAWIFMIPINIPAQDMAILEALRASGGSLGSIGGDLGGRDIVELKEFESLTQNEFTNTVSQIQKIDDAQALEAYRKNLHEKKVDLAFQLCQEDESACYLLEQYKNYKYSKPKPGLKDLELYGVNLFSSYPLSFNQADYSGVPETYVIKPGDIFKILVVGNQKMNTQIQVDRQGQLLVPGIGSINLTGMTFEIARNEITKWVNSKVIGSDVTVSLKAVNSIQVYALGMVDNPGAYKISSASKAINAVIAGGGFNRNSSLRSIQIKRNNSIIQELDLYQFLLFGNTAQDIRLNNGDVVFVGGVKNSVSIHGGVNNPHIFETIEGDTIKDILDFAQGFSADADRSKVTVSRKNQYGQYEIFTTNDFNLKIQHSDIIEVDTIKDETINSIRVVGALKREQEFQYAPGINLGSMINIQYDLLEDTYTPFGLIERYNPETRSAEFIEFDLLSQQALNQIALRPRDMVYVLSQADIDLINSKSIKKMVSNASSFLIDAEDSDTDSLNDQKFLQASMLNPSLQLSEDDQENRREKESDQNACSQNIMSFGNDDFLTSTKLKYSIYKNFQDHQCTAFLETYPELLPVLINSAVPVYGAVRNPGLYPVTERINPLQLLSIAGSSIINSDGELKLDIGQYGGENIFSDLQSSESISNIKYLGVKSLSQAVSSYFVNIYGEVAYPGLYSINANTSITDIYKLAGGLLYSAYPEAGILSRESVKEIEKSALVKAEAELADILGSAITAGVIQQSTTDVLSLVSLMNEISATQPVGRLIAELNPSKLKQNPQLDITLQPGDSIYIPKRNNIVTVYGSVLNPVTVPYNPKFSLNDYIELAGGYKDYADENKTYYILPNGKARIPSKGLFLRSDEILPGSTIIVPRQARPLSGFSLVEAISPVLASLSITLASINSITNSNN
ncbi:SLBB domain-containing protein [Gammaproteobacteria bacterium]|nr:SLBB domain-containing protein [Gammaproteobacteria bacterium]